MMLEIYAACLLGNVLAVAACVGHAADGTMAKSRFRLSLAGIVLLGPLGSAFLLAVILFGKSE